MSKGDGPTEGYPLDRYIDTVSICPYLLDRSGGHRVHTEWQLPLSGVHSIMMEKLAQPDGGGRPARPPPFPISIITYKVVVHRYAPAEKAGTLPYFYSTPKCM
jgi:hypothetical protein